MVARDILRTVYTMRLALMLEFLFLFVFVLLLLPVGREAVPSSAKFIVTNATVVGITYGVAVDPTTGDIYVADTQSDRVLKFGRVNNLQNLTFPIVAFGEPSTTTYLSPNNTASTLYGPTGLWVDTTGTLWIADTDNHRVVFFKNAALRANGSSADGVLGQPGWPTSSTFLNATCAPASPVSMCLPTGVYVDPFGTLWVVDSQNNRVLRFKNAASLTNGAAADSVLGQQSLYTNYGLFSTATTMSKPWGIIGSPTGDLFVSDAGNNRVLYFTASQSELNGGYASFVFMQNSTDLGNGATTSTGGYQPHGVFLDVNGNLYIADAGNNRILIYQGGQLPFANGMAATYVIGQNDFISSQIGTGLNQLDFPTAIYVDCFTNTLWVADCTNNRVLGFADVTSFISSTNFPSLQLELLFQGDTPNVHLLPNAFQSNAAQCNDLGMYLQFDSITEIDSNNDAILSVPFPGVGYSVSTFTDANSTQHFDFSVTLASAQINVSYALFVTTQTVREAGKNFAALGSTVELSISISHWNFSDPANTLALTFSLFGNPQVTSITNEGLDNQGLIVYALASSAMMTTTFRFLPVALADGVNLVPIGIDFQGLTALVLYFPHFVQTVEYDPDISVTLDYNSGGGVDLFPLLALIVLVIPLVVLLAGLVACVTLTLHHKKKSNSVRDILQGMSLDTKISIQK